MQLDTKGVGPPALAMVLQKKTKHHENKMKTTIRLGDDGFYYQRTYDEQKLIKEVRLEYDYRAHTFRPA